MGMTTAIERQIEKRLNAKLATLDKLKKHGAPVVDIVRAELEVDEITDMLIDARSTDENNRVSIAD